MTSRRGTRRFAVGALLFACLNSTSCGTPGAHDLEVYAYRVGPTEDRAYTLADGSEHTIELRGIADVSTATLAQIVNVMSRAPPGVARSCESITYVTQAQFHAVNVVGDAHTSLNAGNICLLRVPLEDWLYHEATHLFRDHADEGLVQRFDSISAELYGQHLGPIEVAGNKARRWSHGLQVPCGDYGPAFGMVSAYAGNNGNECMGEVAEALYCLTYHTPETCGDRENNPYVLIAQAPANHRLEDHIARVEVLYEMGAISKEMKDCFDATINPARMKEIMERVTAMNSH